MGCPECGRTFSDEEVDAIEREAIEDADARWLARVERLRQMLATGRYPMEGTAALDDALAILEGRDGEGKL